MNVDTSSAVSPRASSVNPTKPKAHAEKSINATKQSAMNFAKKRADFEAESSTVFRFTDLPPELRNMIYRQLLRTRGEIRIVRRSVVQYIHVLRSALPSARTRTIHVIKGTTMGTLDGKARVLPVAKVHPLEILRVSKDINEESSPIFYGANKFHFDTAYGFSDFRNMIGGSFDLLKDISVKSVWYKNQDALGESLFFLYEPERVTLGVPAQRFSTINLKQVAKWFASMLEEFVRNLAERLDIRDPKQRKRFDTLHFMVGPWVHVKLEDKTVVSSSGDYDLHKAFSKAIRRQWARQEKADLKELERHAKRQGIPLEAEKWRLRMEEVNKMDMEEDAG